MFYFINISKFTPTQTYYNSSLTLIGVIINKGVLQLRGISSNLEGNNFKIQEIQVLKDDELRVFLEFAYMKMAGGLPEKSEDGLLGTMQLKQNDRRNLIEDIFNDRIKRIF